MSNKVKVPIVEAMLRLSRRWAAASFLAAVVTTLVGCATKDATAKAPQPKNGIAEYRQIVDESSKEIQTALRALDQVSAQTKTCPPKVITAFAKEAQRLQVDSIKVRSRTQALQARGDAYFENWHENMVRLKDPKIRALAEQHRPELQQNFEKIKVASKQTGDAFRPFLAGLRKLSGELENDPSAVGAEVNRELIRSTGEKGREVLQSLANVRQELDAMTAIITPTKSTK